MKPIVVITDSSGLIGSEVARRLAPDFIVVGVDITEPAANSPIDLSLYMDVTADMSVSDVVDRILSEYGSSVAAVVHLSAYYDFSGEPSPRYDQVTVGGTRRILEELRRKDVDVERFIFASTMLVHAPVRPGERIDEESPLGPRFPPVPGRAGMRYWRSRALPRSRRPSPSIWPRFNGGGSTRSGIRSSARGPILS